MKKLSFGNDRNKRDWCAAKRKKHIADLYDIDISGGIHRFMKNNLSSINTDKSGRKAKAYMKKYNNSLNEDKTNMRSDSIIEDWLIDGGEIIEEEILPNE